MYLYQIWYFKKDGNKYTKVEAATSEEEVKKIILKLDEVTKIDETFLLGRLIQIEETRASSRMLLFLFFRRSLFADIAGNT